MTDEQRQGIEAATQQFAAQLSIPYFDTTPRLDISGLVGKLTVAGMQAYGIVPLELYGNKLRLGVYSQTNRELLEPLRQRLVGYEVHFAFISDFGWERLFNRYQIAGNEAMMEAGNFQAFGDGLLNMEPKFMFEPVVQLAAQLGASDIHLEPGPQTARLRFRLDGTLQPIITIPRERAELFTSDMQLRAGVKWGSDQPQGGRMTVPIINDDGDITPLDMRLETIPSLHGQDVVIRLFNLSARYMSIENLKLRPKQAEILTRAVAHPRGMVLAVGPTGSGKTSTLYAVMNHLNNPEVKIVTLEDPVEYELEGVSQIPVRSDDQQLFIEKLRAVLREDPNVIMIGEIRDADTAKTALQAALTGHLVLSTFHASGAAAAISRLMDMIGENPLLASSVKLIMAQRLVRALCSSCKEEYKPSKAELLEIKTALAVIPESRRPAPDKIMLHRAVGCDQCHHIGYKGRLSLVEQLLMTTSMEELITRGTKATTTQALEQAAIKDGMVPLLADGVLKAVDGETTLEEVYGAVGE